MFLGIFRDIFYFFLGDLYFHFDSTEKALAKTSLQLEKDAGSIGF